jgi:small subunit ribosomal protein S6e
MEVKDDQAAVFVGKHIGDKVNVTPLGLKGYEVKITGGSDKQGFPMRKDAHITGRTKALVSKRTQGYKPQKAGVRVRKTVVGDIIGDNISQVNTVVVKQGKDPIPKLLGLEKPEEAPAEGEAKEEAKAEKPEEPKEKKEEAPKEEAKPEAPEKKEEK